MKCTYCGGRTKASGGLCLTHKTARNRGADRVRYDNLLVDEAGGAFWVWDSRGEVLVTAQKDRTTALIVLGLGAENVPEEPNYDDE